MTTKFHIQPETGEIGRCVATIKCKYGFPLDKHFSSAAEAQNFYEDSMNKNLVKTFNNSRETAPVALSSVLDVELLNKMIAEKYVLQNSHPEDKTLKILCYGMSAQFEAKWNDVTKLARGLMVQTSDSKFGDAVIVQRPWAKFFTLQQIESGWALGDDGEGEKSAEFDMSSIDFNAPAEVTDKMDGSMGILYLSPDGNPALSTKGSFESPQSIKFTNLLRTDKKMFEASQRLLEEHGNTTFVFEMTGGGESQIVLKYGKDEISLLGAVEKSNGLYHSTSDYSRIWGTEAGLAVAEKMPASTLGEAFELPDRENREGVVVRIMSDDPEKQMQIKIKQSDYLALHKTRTTFSKKSVRELIREIPATYGDLIKIAETKDVTSFEMIDKALDNEGIDEGSWAESVQTKMRDGFESSIIPYAEKVAGCYNKVQGLPEQDFEGDRKEIMKKFAESLKDSDKEERGFLLSFFNERLNGVDSLSKSATRDMWKIAGNV